MIQVMFVCHGNICRSPMAEFVLRNMVEERGLSHLFNIASSATSTEEIGNPVHHGTRKKLKEYNISVEGKKAIQLKKADYKKYDYLIGMEQVNIMNMQRILGEKDGRKIRRLLDFSERPRDIADPWYTGDFDETYEDVYEGCVALLETILQENK